MDCISADKTKTYIERSKPYPLEICLGPVKDTSRLEEALILAATHISRIGTMSVSGNPTQVLPILVERFSCSVPLLEKLNVSIVCNQVLALPDKLFDGDLSSLHELPLAGFITSISWRGLSNLTTFELCRVPEDKILLTQLLDFFESAPHLRCIKLHDSIPNSSNAPAERVVSLPRLKDLRIIATSTLHPSQSPPYPSRGIAASTIYFQWRRVPDSVVLPQTSQQPQESLSRYHN